MNAQNVNGLAHLDLAIYSGKMHVRLLDTQGYKNENVAHSFCYSMSVVKCSLHVKRNANFYCSRWTELLSPWIVPNQVKQVW